MPETVELVEVGARDGLQNEQRSLDVKTRVELVRRLVAAGLSTVEAGAFVSPKRIPQMASTDAVLGALLPRPAGVSYPVLTPNLRGYGDAKAALADTVAVFGAASESFSQSNINVSIDESLRQFGEVAEAALADGMRVRGYVSCVLGCPYEGSVPTAAVARVAVALLEMGCYEISLGDTIGVGTASQVRALVRSLSTVIPVTSLAGHFHDTYGQGVANVYAALEEGVRVFDASVSGLGGCPYAPGASGNVATEDVAYLLQGSGLDTGVDLDALVETSRWISEVLGRRPGSKLATQ